MKYHKKAHHKLHHVEVHPSHDGGHIVEAHLIHHPPEPQGKGKAEHMAYARPSEDYPNKTEKYLADDHQEAAEIVEQILGAHQHDKARRTMAGAHGEDTEAGEAAE